MIIVGVTGVLGTGKSTLSGMLRDTGFNVIDIDELGREASRSGEVVKAVAGAFGEGFVKNGSIDRGAMKELVFRDPKALRTIEGIIHPAVGEALCRAIAALLSSGAQAAIIDHPLLFETGFFRKCQKVVVVSASAQRIQERLRIRGITEDDMERRLKFQIPLAEKEGRADFVVNNNGSIEDLKEECLRLEAKIQEWEEE
jgi:dephospho-CoA kinase